MPRKSKTAVADHYRQGDILIQRIESIPAAARNITPKFGSIVLGEGETVGHRHEILHTAGVTSYELNEGFYLGVEEETELVHPEHDQVTLLPGTYEVIHQSEFARKEFVRVVD
jgi:hypothetical protein